jgi:PD-(D/E)XK endonuclease
VRKPASVSRPIDDERYDLILDLRPQLVRIQCKWAVLYGDVVVVGLYSNRRSREGVITRRYDPADVDGFCAYCDPAPGSSDER